jgi:predicted ribosome quality control (RQC) complex YloA/Tae2 family protein
VTLGREVGDSGPMAIEVPVGKETFTSLDTLAVVRELRAIGRAHVDKAFDLGPDRIGLTFRAAGVGRLVLVARAGQYAALVREIPERDEELSPLAKELRRVLGGAGLVSVAEPGGERYLEAELSRGDADGALRLGLELFAPGNVLVARGDKLVVVAHPKTWSKRSVRVGQPYSRPPARDNPWTMDLHGIEAVLRGSRTDRASTLAARLGLGGPLAAEVLARTGTAGDRPSTAEVEDFAPLIHATLSEMLAEVGEHPKGYLYSVEGVALDVTPFESRRLSAHSGVTTEALDSFSEAAHRYFDTRVTKATPKESDAGAAIAELQRQRLQQERAIEQLREEVARLGAQADTLLANYPEAERQLAVAPPDEDGRVVLSIEGAAIPLVRPTSIRSAAQSLYDEAKRLQAKLAGASAALGETDTRLSRTATQLLAATPKASPAAARRRRTPAWYERYRWFRTSEGLLVIGGRDAASNDLVVRRYLNPGDRYIHAEIHGAPSVIVKHPAPGEPEGTDASLEEAAQWGVAFSKAWRAGLASASAFAVEADQVSKSAASGEYVARGAWVIHGTKRTFKDLPVELGLGTTDDHGEERWIVAPTRAIERTGRLRYVLTPGPERERAEREVELARDIGISRDRLQPLLPSGGLAYRRV